MSDDPIKFNIDKGDLISKVHRYELSKKGGGTYQIKILECVSGSDISFMAIPDTVSKSPGKFCGIGDTEIEALNDCLSKIKDKKQSAV